MTEFNTLSARQREIATLVSLRLTNMEIGLELSLCEATIKTHLCNVYSILGFENRVGSVNRIKLTRILIEDELKKDNA